MRALTLSLGSALALCGVIISPSMLARCVTLACEAGLCPDRGWTRSDVEQWVAQHPSAFGNVKLGIVVLGLGLIVYGLVMRRLVGPGEREE